MKGWGFGGGDPRRSRRPPTAVSGGLLSGRRRGDGRGESSARLLSQKWTRSRGRGEGEGGRVARSAEGRREAEPANGQGEKGRADSKDHRVRFKRRPRREGPVRRRGEARADGGDGRARTVGAGRAPSAGVEPRPGDDPLLEGHRPLLVRRGTPKDRVSGQSQPGAHKALLY